MKNPFSLPIRKFMLFPLGMCGVLAAVFLAARGFPRSFWPTFIVAGISFVAGISCVLIAGLLLLLSAQKAVREALGFIPQTVMASNQEDRAKFPKVKEGRPRLDPFEFNLFACVAETLQAIRPQARKKGLEIACEVQPDVPELVIGDEPRLRQVLINMVGNTIKFTERGEVMVRVERQSYGRGDCVLHFTVQRMSVAITEGKQGMMAQDISHAHVSAMRPFREARAGMTNVSQLMEMMRGAAWVEFESQLVRKMRGRVWMEVKGEHAGCFHFTAPFGISARVAIIQPAQVAGQKSLRARELDEDDRAA